MKGEAFWAYSAHSPTNISKIHYNKQKEWKIITVYEGVKIILWGAKEHTIILQIESWPWE